MSTHLEQIKSAVVSALEQAGLSARAAYEPGWAKAFHAPVAAVGFRRGETRGEALGSYLGSQTDPDTLAQKEIYGLRMELTLSLDIYSPPETGAAGCDSALQILHRVMLEGLPAGLRAQELSWEETGWDTDTSMFLRRGSMTCSAFFTAETTGEAALLSDFILKGVMTK